MKKEVEESVKKTDRKCCDIVQDKLTSLSFEVQLRMPDVKTLNKDMQRHRRSFVQSTKAPKRREDIDLPEDCRFLKSGEEWLLHDSGKGDKQRFLIFGTRKNVERMKRAEKVYSDGTFKRPKRLFAQVSSYIPFLTGNNV